MKKKSNLDEMQEQTLYKIEHNGMWFCLIALFVAIILQGIIYGFESFDEILGEFIVFISLCLYISIDCIRNGIWDRRLKPNFKTNLLLSLFAGLFAAIVSAINLYRFTEGDVLFVVIASVVSFVFTSLFTLGVLSAAAKMMKKQKEKLEKEDD